MPSLTWFKFIAPRTARLETQAPSGSQPIEVHPFNTRTNATSFCKTRNIAVEAYAPLARAMRMKHPAIVKLADKYGRTPAQLMRWSLQHGYVPLPKGSNKERIVVNVDVGGFDIKQMGWMRCWWLIGTPLMLLEEERTRGSAFWFEETLNRRFHWQTAAISSVPHEWIVNR